ncbi:MAG TPA: hypothetical protein VFS43_16285 [Polyangiaceae bacterium]|nr:hypothetical protein [Polyangiaceae bacterium]
MPEEAIVAPRAPFDAWPAQAFDHRFGFGWWADPATCVFQTSIEHGTVASVEVVQGWVDAALAVRRAEIAQSGGLFLLYDVRSLRHFDADAMRLHLARMQARPRTYLRASVIVVEKPSALLQVALHTANLVAARVANAKVELTSDLAAVLRDHAVRPPGPALTFPAAPP